MSSLRERLQLTILPLTSDFLTEKRSEDARGQAHLIINNQPFRRLLALTLNPGSGYRGSHYHQHKSEWLYIMAGQARLQCRCLISNESLEVDLEEGSRLLIPAQVGHRISALTPLIFIEFTDNAYDQADDIPYSFN
jgi:mannose-6-phosphate isomerase-like protein (cupin superfamily)